MPVKTNFIMPGTNAILLCSNLAFLKIVYAAALRRAEKAFFLHEGMPLISIQQAGVLRTITLLGFLVKEH